MDRQRLLRELQKSGKVIVLIGLMGSGKSTIGKMLGRQLRIQFYDSDKEIENRLGLSVVDIYDFMGRDYFKEKEHEMVKEILSYGIVVLSTGSDTFLNEELRSLIQERAITIWLKADVETLYNRIIRRSTRPEIDRVEDKKAVLQQMIDEKYPVYEKADIVVKSHDMDPHYVLDTIMVRLAKLLNIPAN